MIKLKHSKIQTALELESGDVAELVIERPAFLYEVFRDLLDDVDDHFSFASDGQELNLSKNVLFLTDLFFLDPNGKKMLTGLYKKAEATFLSSERRDAIEKINHMVLELAEQISSELNCETVEVQGFTLSSLLNAVGFKFATEEASFLETLVTYIKASMEIMNLKCIVTYELLSLLGPDEIKKLSNELCVLGISMISFGSKSQKVEKGIRKSLVIDPDLCEIA